MASLLTSHFARHCIQVHLLGMVMSSSNLLFTICLLFCCPACFKRVLVSRVHGDHVHYRCRAPIYTEDDKTLSASITKVVVDDAKVSSAGVLVRTSFQSAVVRFVCPSGSALHLCRCGF